MGPANFVVGPAGAEPFWEERGTSGFPSPLSPHSAYPRPYLIRRTNYGHTSQTSLSTWATQGNSSTQVSGPGSAPTSNFQGPSTSRPSECYAMGSAGGRVGPLRATFDLCGLSQSQTAHRAVAAPDTGHLETAVTHDGPHSSVPGPQTLLFRGVGIFSLLSPSHHHLLIFFVLLQP